MNGLFNSVYPNWRFDSVDTAFPTRLPISYVSATLTKVSLFIRQAVKRASTY